MNELNQYASMFRIQIVDIIPICIGQAMKNDRKAYFLLIESLRLLEFRRLVYANFCYHHENCRSRMDPDAFQPHITIGYEGSDLFVTDHVYKGVNTCSVGLDFKSSEEILREQANSPLYMLIDDDEY
jgi:hypothetical protein